MKSIKGDLIAFAREGRFDVIVHGCNCFNNMGSGIARTIRQELPAASIVDKNTKSGDKSKLGTLSYTPINDYGFRIINAYTQYNYGSGRHTEYEAIRSCFRQIKRLYEFDATLRIGYPLIGAGLGGGDWDIISKIIDEELEGMDHTLVKWDMNAK